MSPCDELPNVQITIPAGKYGNPEPWTPSNVGDRYGGKLSLKDGLANSVNVISANLMNRVGPRQVVSLAKKMGITSELLEVPSIALGVSEVSIYEMVGAYGTFANEGIYVKPVMVTSIEDKNGTILFEFAPETRDVLSREAAYVTVNLMQGVTQKGSGARLRHSGQDSYRPEFKKVITGYPYQFENPIAGKTGTTQNQSDGWFMGMVPNLVSGVWVGAQDRAVHFSNITYGQGGTMALPIWALYMKKCYADEELNVSKEEFTRPENLRIRVDCSVPAVNDSIKVPLLDELDDLGFK
jgi:penicillin-binding protein 1A